MNKATPSGYYCRRQGTVRAKPNADYDETITTTAYQAQTGRRPYWSSRDNHDETTIPTIEEADDEDDAVVSTAPGVILQVSTGRIPDSVYKEPKSEDGNG